MFKKVLATMLGAMVILGGMTVNCYAEDGGVVAVNTAYGEVEVPYAPTRICVLDLSVMDILDTLGLGENVVVLQWHKHYPAYLEEYYNSETIISLTGNNNGHGGSTEVTDEDADPYEMYYSIDADLIIGTTEKIDEDLYAILSQIAPTVVLTPALEASESLYDAVCENAETIASIWGVEGEYESYISEYDEIYAQLCETVEGKSYVMANGNTELGLIQIGSSGSYYGDSNSASAASAEKSEKSEASETSEKSEKSEASETSEKSEKSEASEAEGNASSNAAGKGRKKNNTANADTFLSQLGMTNISENVSEDAAAETIAAAVEAGTSNAAAAAKAIAAINEAAPDGVFVFNYGYSSLDEIREDGFDITGLDNLTCPTGFISIELTYTSGGLQAVTSMLDVMAEMFLD